MGKKHSPLFLGRVEHSRSIINECNIDEFILMINDNESLHIIDVRENHEFESGHMKGAIHIGKGVLERDIEKHPFATSDRIVLYCGGGFRSAIAAQSMKEMGYENVYSLWGGWRAILGTDIRKSNL
ncbi:rhodanese-like domain-containing protein [Candidatus Poseidoniales archaeon]|nr:rhodanese-like domain-containing protein [Candidatus Poseidoniales archaeon]